MLSRHSTAVAGVAYFRRTAERPQFFTKEHIVNNLSSKKALVARIGIVIFTLAIMGVGAYHEFIFPIWGWITMAGAYIVYAVWLEK